MPSTLLEAAETLLPLTAAGLVFARSARRERERIAQREAGLRAAQRLETRTPAGLLDRLHERRMRRRALRMLARHRPRAAG